MAYRFALGFRANTPPTTGSTTTANAGSESSPSSSRPSDEPGADPASSQYPPRTLSISGPASQPPPPLSTTNDELPVALKDHIFLHQLVQDAPPLSFTPTTIVESGVCTSEKDAATAHYGLVKAGVLVDLHKAEHHHHHIPHFSFSDKKKVEEGEKVDAEFLPHTNMITASLPNQVKLPVPGVKLLVKALFFWEEEVVRWQGKQKDMEELARVLEKYKAERQALEAAGARGLSEEEAVEERARLDKMIKEVQFYVQAVRLRQRVKPSKRESNDQLPQYR